MDPDKTIFNQNMIALTEERKQHFEDTQLKEKDLQLNLEEIEKEEKIKTNKTELQEIQLPGNGTLISDFAKNMANLLKSTNMIFYRIDSKEVVEVGKVKTKENEKEIYLGFLPIKPNRFTTLIEQYSIPGKRNIKYSKEQKKVVKDFIPKSINPEIANTVLASQIMQDALPKIQRIFTTPLPILYNGEITFPKKGYDERFLSWLPLDSPEIIKTNMHLEEAKQIIENIIGDFCFQTEIDKYNAIAGLLTPYLRGLFSSFNVRTPVFFYIANRERAGKDYCAGITGILYEGHALDEPPLSNSEKHNNNSEELRKKILSALMSGRKRLHFANNKGYIDNASFEQITTSTKYSDRLLGKNELLIFDNEIDFSLSGNMGVGYTPDFANRCKFVRLFLDIENANERTFKNPDLHGYILANRGLILSALFCLVKNWNEKGRPKGKELFASFNEWASICGGIMETAGYQNPCKPDKDSTLISGDIETNDMKMLFEECFKKSKEQKINREEIIELMQKEDIFSSLDLVNSHSDKIKFGNTLSKYIGRVLSDIRMILTNPGEKRGSRQLYKFTKEKFEIKTIEDFL